MVLHPSIKVTFLTSSGTAMQLGVISDLLTPISNNSAGLLSFCAIAPRAETIWLKALLRNESRYLSILVLTLEFLNHQVGKLKFGKWGRKKSFLSSQFKIERTISLSRNEEHCNGKLFPLLYLFTTTWEEEATTKFGLTDFFIFSLFFLLSHLLAPKGWFWFFGNKMYFYIFAKYK